MKREIPRTGEVFRHFKNKMYQIVTIATHSETGEKLVIYQALYGDYSCCARPLDMFMSEVDKEKYPEVTAKYRFERVDLSELEPIHIEPKVVDIESVDVKAEYNKTECEEVIENYDVKDTSDLEEYDETEQVNPDLLRFLDANTYEEKRNLLISMKDRMTNDLIDNIAASLDIAVNDGDIEERFLSLYNCVTTMEKYEVIDRLR